MRSRSRFLPVLLACCVTLALVASYESEAQAQINVGGEMGMAYRSSDPKLSPGLAAGAHAEYKLIPMLALGPYFLWSNLSPDQPGIDGNASFVSIGGRLRFTLPLPGSSFRPYAFAGLGRVGATYPGEAVSTGMYSGAPPAAVVKRDGWFLEVPLGLGLGYQVARIAQLSLDFAFRPGFNFKGDAYEGSLPYDQPKMGLSVLLGAAIDF